MITPFTTKTLSVGHLNMFRFGLYAFTEAMQFAVFAVITLLIIRSQQLPDTSDLQNLQSSRWQTTTMSIGFALSIPLYLIIGPFAFAAWALVPIVGGRIVEPLLRRRQR